MKTSVYLPDDLEDFKMTKIVPLLLLLVSLVAGGFGDDQDYCAICSDHTLCIYPEKGVMCQPLLASGTNQDDIDLILKTHNDLRSKVANGNETQGNPGPQPGAADMRALYWDEELANIAQRWANQCKYGHEACRNVERYQVGQNFAVSQSTSPNFGVNWQGIVQSWYDEVSQFDNTNIDNFHFDRPTGHYSQVVWAKTDRVGCGYARYKLANSPRYLNEYVCNYGESGNFGNVPMYMVGEVCAKCPEGDQLCANGLCLDPAFGSNVKL